MICSPVICRSNLWPKTTWVYHSQGYAGEEQLGEALKGADVIIIPAGVPRKPGMTRDDLFKVRQTPSPMCTYCIKICVNILAQLSQQHRSIFFLRTRLAGRHASLHAVRKQDSM